MFGVISAPSLFGVYNDYTLTILDNHKRLRATIWPDPRFGRDVLRQYVAIGVRGLRFLWSNQGPDLTSYEYRCLLRRMADLGLHAELNIPNEQLPSALRHFETAGVKIVVDHFGLLRAPHGLESEGFLAVVQAAQRGVTWVKLSGAFRIDRDNLAAATHYLLGSVGPERLVWGSDAPFVGWETKVDYDWTVRTFTETVPDAQIRREISNTGIKLYFH